MMRANSLALIWLRSSQRRYLDHGDDNDETGPDEFDESEATDDNGCWWTELEILPSPILICQSDRCNN